MIEGDEEEVAALTSGPTGEALLRERFLLHSSSEPPITPRAPGSAGAGRMSRCVNELRVQH